MKDQQQGKDHVTAWKDSWQEGTDTTCHGLAPCGRSDPAPLVYGVHYCSRRADSKRSSGGEPQRKSGGVINSTEESWEFQEKANKERKSRFFKDPFKIVNCKNLHTSLHHGSGSDHPCISVGGGLWLLPISVYMDDISTLTTTNTCTVWLLRKLQENNEWVQMKIKLARSSFPHWWRPHINK